MDIRAKILEAAVDVYSGCGFRGATTRRIAEKAGVNEVTLFRHFGSKYTLLHEAIACAGRGMVLASLPDHPVAPSEELRAWAASYLREVRARRSLIRTCMGEIEEHPNILPPNGPTVQAARGLAAYLGRLQAHGLAGRHFDPSLAAPMLMGTLFADAMGRDIMPELYQSSEEDALQQYVDLFLRAVGASNDSETGE